MSLLTVVTFFHRIKKCHLKYSHLFSWFWRIYDLFQDSKNTKVVWYSINIFESTLNDKKTRVFKAFFRFWKIIEKACFLLFWGSLRSFSSSKYSQKYCMDMIRNTSKSANQVRILLLFEVLKQFPDGNFCLTPPHTHPGPS